MKILNFGSLNIDRVYSVEHFVKPGETLTSSAYNVFAGGKGLNQSIALARAGSTVCHVGKIGQDGLFLKEMLADNGVDVSLISLSESPTGHAIIQVADSGENSIILFGGANLEITEEQVRTALESANPGDWILLQNEINGLGNILSLASQRQLRIIFNPAPMTSDVLNLPLESVEWLIVNEIEGEMIAGRKADNEIIDTILAKYPNLSLILTLGSRGVYYGNNSDRLFVPAEAVDAVDTTGAGDTFVGYFLAELVKTTNIKDCLELAARAAAFCVTCKGAATSIPTRAQLL